MISHVLLEGSMRRRMWWLVGFAGALLVIALSATPGHRARLATAEAAPPTQGAPQAAQPPTPEGSRTDGTVHLNFRNVDILQMIALISELTGRNFLVDDKVRGHMTLIAPQPVTRAEAYQIFLTALAMQGFTVVSQGPISTIVPLRDAKTSPLPTVTDTVHPHQ
jgi:type II secretory pathway component GspD/PulD (secretin)